MRLLGVVLLVGATTGWASAQTATPGPAARMGAALDRVYADVRGEVAEATLWTKVRLALLESLKTDALGISIVVRGNQVTLGGQVGTRVSRERAGELARTVVGVGEVVNRVQIGPQAEPEQAPLTRALAKAERDVSDGVVAAHVKARLLEELGRIGFAIEVDVVDGVVTLSGTVPDVARQRLALDLARQTTGVRKVLNLLRTAP